MSTEPVRVGKDEEGGIADSMDPMTEVTPDAVDYGWQQLIPAWLLTYCVVNIVLWNYSALLGGRSDRNLARPGPPSPPRRR